MEMSDGATLTEVILVAFDGELVTDEVFVLPVGPAELVGSVEKVVFVDCIAFASEPTPLPHPEAQKAKVIRRTKNRNKGKLRG